jgi:hypothetical protein
VLGPNVGVPQSPRLFLGQDDYLARAFCKSLKQTPKNPTPRDRLQDSHETTAAEALRAVSAVASPAVGSRFALRPRLTLALRSRFLRENVAERAFEEARQ